MNSIRIKLEVSGDLAKQLHKTLKNEYLKDTNVNVFLEEEQKESMSGHKFIDYYLRFTIE